MMMSLSHPAPRGSPLNDDATLTPAEPIPPTPPPALSKVFIGKDGLRAGWSLFIFLALLAALLFCVNVIGHKLHPPVRRAANAEISATFSFIGESVPFLAVLLVTWIMSKIERRPNSVYGLGGRRKLPHFLAGLAWGVTCLSLLGLNEEYLTRGYLQYTLSRGLAGFYQWAFKTRQGAAWGFWTSAAVFSILFGLGHKGNPGESPIGLLSAGLVGIVLCLSLWRTGSLWWAIGFHAAWDWAQSFLYGVADSGVMVQHHLLATHPVGKPILSGGATGPEGSIFILAILALVSLIILLTLPRTRYGDTPARSAELHPGEAS